MKAFVTGNAYRIIAPTPERQQLIVELVRPSVITLVVGVHANSHVDLTPKEASLLIRILGDAIQEVLLGEEDESC